MKKILFLFVALIMSVASAWAQDWTNQGSLRISPALNSEGNFASGTVFYTIQSKKDGGGYLSTASMSESSLSFTSSGITADAARWAILGDNTNGFQFVNKATKEAIGMNKFTVTNKENESSAKASYMTDDLSDANSKFAIAPHKYVADYFVITANDDHYFFWNQLTTLGYWYSGAGYNYGYYGWKNNEAGTANTNKGDDGASFKFNFVEELVANTFTFVLPEDVTLTYDGHTYNNGGTVDVTGAIAATDITIEPEAPAGYEYSIVVDATAKTVTVTKVPKKLSSLAEVVEGTLYTIQSVDRGYFVYSSTYADEYISGSARASYTFSATDPNCQFAFIQHDGKTYLWSKGAQNS